MLDLRKMTEKLYDVTLTDGHIIYLQKPTQAMYVTMLELTSQNYTEIELLEKAMSLFVRVFNRNTEGLVFKKKDFEMFTLDNILYILKDYGEFISQELGE